MQAVPCSGGHLSPDPNTASRGSGALACSQITTHQRTTTRADHFSRNEPGVFAPLRDMLLTRGDHYMHLADMTSYLEADHRLVKLYADSEEWARKAILNVASSAKFSSDRTIAEYAANIWHVKPCPMA